MNIPIMLFNDGCTRERIDFSSDAVAISKPVGKLAGQAGNLPGDVERIQQALNDIPSSKGGCRDAVPLKVDRNCGPKTIAAILRYQTTFAGGGDSRVDPGGRTARQMAIDLHPFHAPDEELVKMVLRLVPGARACIKAAQTRLAQAKPAFEGRSGGFLQTLHVAAAEMVNRHFALDKFADWRKELGRIEHLFRTMELVIARGYDSPLAQWQGVFVPNTFPSKERALAYTYAGGWRNPGGRDPNVTPAPQRSDRIYICRSLSKLSDEFCTMAIVHELAHFVGEPQGPDLVDDHNRRIGWVDTPQMKVLVPWQRTRTAQAFANFAFDAAHGRKPTCL